MYSKGCLPSKYMKNESLPAVVGYLAGYLAMSVMLLLFAKILKSLFSIFVPQYFVING